MALINTNMAKDATIQSIIRDEDTAHASGNKGVPIFGLRSDNDIPTADDGDYTLLKLDEKGRLKVASMPASYPDVIGDITNIQAAMNTDTLVSGAYLEVDVARASNLMIMCGGTFAGVNCSFEGTLEPLYLTDGVTLNPNRNLRWFSVQAVRTNANTIETATGALSAMPVYGWELSVNALQRFRIRATARTSGTQSWRFKLGTYATEPIPAAQATATQPVSGNVTATPVTSTSYTLNSLATTNLVAIKASAGTMYYVGAFNNGASTAYVKFYNKTTAPVLASDIPIMVIPIAAGSIMPQVNFGASGHRFATGIAMAITGGASDTDATAVAAGQVKIWAGYL